MTIPNDVFFYNNNHYNTVLELSANEIMILTEEGIEIWNISTKKKVKTLLTDNDIN